MHPVVLRTSVFYLKRLANPNHSKGQHSYT